MPKCSFCNSEIARGTGTMYVKKEGAIFWFCSQKCMRNMFKLRRLPLSTRWTDSYHVEKSARGKTKEKTNVKAKPAKGKKGKK